MVESTKRKAQKQLGMGDFFKCIKIDKRKDGRTVVFERPLSPVTLTETEINPKLKCKGCYKKGLLTSLGKRLQYRNAHKHAARRPYIDSRTGISSAAPCD